MVVSFYNRKGGVGKTALCFLAGRYLAAAGRSVVIFDLDPQKSITSHFIRLHVLDEERICRHNIFTLYMKQDSFEDVAITINENLVLIPSDYDL